MRGWRTLTMDVVAAVAAMLASGCVVGPDFRRPEAPQAERYTETALPAETASAATAGGAAQRFVSGADLPAEWWSLYRSEPLDRLIREALAASPTLATARARLLQARETLTARSGALLFPGVNMRGAAARQKISNASFGEAGSSPPFSLYNASVEVAYLLDVAGGSRRQIESLQALVDYQGYQLEAARLALTGNVVTAAIREASLRAQLEATREILASQQEQVRRVERQYALGGVGRLELIALRAQAAQTEAALPPLENSLSQARHLLAVLTGRLPSEAALPAFDLGSLHLPEEIPVSLPSRLALQRPDIRTAEALLHQASAQIGVATASLYPQVTLSAEFGLQANQLHGLFTGPAVWSLGAGLLAPIFHGGQLEAERRAAVAAYEAAQGQYRDTVLQAFRNVADALRALESDARAVKSLAQTEALQRDTLELTRKQYALGGTSYLALLVAERAYQQARLELVLARAARYADSAALFQALGGGWWNRDTGAAAPPVKAD